jgi:hypothetical protein
MGLIPHAQFHAMRIAALCSQMVCQWPGPELNRPGTVSTSGVAGCVDWAWGILLVGAAERD